MYLAVLNDFHMHGPPVQNILDGRQLDPQVVCVEDAELADTLEFFQLWA